MSPHTIQIEIPTPYYALFDTSRLGLPAVVVVNRALLAFQHLEIFPWHLWIEIEAQHLAENRMPTPEESALLTEIGDEIERAVASGKTENEGENTLFLARTTTDGCRELYFQVHNPEIANAQLQNLLHSRIWQREWEYGMENDDTWQKAGKFFQMFSTSEGFDA